MDRAREGEVEGSHCSANFIVIYPTKEPGPRLLLVLYFQKLC